MTNKQLKHIQSILGLADINIRFKPVNSQFKHNGCLLDGLCTSYTDNSYEVTFCTNEDQLHTVLHELAHVEGNVNGNGRSCADCDEIADNLLEYIQGEI
jgi:hypothetical protein